MQSLYQLLGIDSAATLAEIKRAYRKLVRRFHPDVARFHPDMDATGIRGAERRIREINAAYEVLSDPESRARYDLFRESVQKPDADREERERDQSERRAWAERDRAEKKAWGDRDQAERKAWRERDRQEREAQRAQHERYERERAQANEASRRAHEARRDRSLVGGCWVHGRSGTVRERWGVVDRVERQGVGLYNVFLSEKTGRAQTKLWIDGRHLSGEIEYEAHGMLRVGVFASRTHAWRNDADFAIYIGAEGDG